MRPKKRKTHKKSRERFQNVQAKLFDKVAKDFRFQAVHTGEFRFEITAASRASRKNLARMARTIEPNTPPGMAQAHAAVALLYIATSLFREDENDSEMDPSETIASIEATTADTFEIELHHESVRKLCWNSPRSGNAQPPKRLKFCSKEAPPS